MAPHRFFTIRLYSNLRNLFTAASLLIILQLDVTYSFNQKDLIYTDYLRHNNSAIEDIRLNNITKFSNGTIFEPVWYITSDLPYGVFESVLIAIVLVCVILGTIIGNILVCIAVCLVRKLRRPYNYLIVSLAVSDLCVATLVMPMAMMYEVLGKWPFGPIVCDLWVSFDVLSCTASILNLCMISVDRYYAITKPLEYGVKRTPRRMIFCVILVWFGAACISLPPLLILGNEKEESHCRVCQNFGYQIYATVGSFYIPLAVMIVVYYKIFRAARKIVLEEKRAQFHLETPYYLEINVKNGGTAEAKLITKGLDDDTSEDRRNESHAKISKKGTVMRTTSSMTRCFSSGQRHSNESQYPILHQQMTTNNPSHGLPRPFYKDELNGTNERQTEKSRNLSTVTKIRNSFSSFTGKSQPNSKEQTHSSNSPHQKKLRFQLAKERKASTTLGIIMSAFIVCWLPFFVLALVRPFLSDQDSIPPSFSSLFLWLGYANSLLNPIIYATLNKDFRKPFQEILFFRCSNLNHIMREDFYHSQYGDPENHHCVLNNSSRAQNFEVETEIITTVTEKNIDGSSATYL